MPKTKRWRNTQKIEWMTDKVADDDDYKVIPWIASSKSSDQKVKKILLLLSSHLPVCK